MTPRGRVTEVVEAGGGWFEVNSDCLTELADGLIPPAEHDDIEKFFVAEQLRHLHPQVIAHVTTRQELVDHENEESLSVGPPRFGHQPKGQFRDLVG